MKYWIALITISLGITQQAYPQELKTKNIIVITLDGYRWQEVFEGADPKLLANARYTDDTAVVGRFSAKTSLERREKLMPFFWDIISREGQLYGNRNYKNKVNCVNHHLLSYPGYSEMLVGFPERKVTNNGKKENPNATVLEFVHKHKGFHHKVAAFATWDVFPYILRKNSVDFHVNAGNDAALGKISETETRLNMLRNENSKRPDQHTFDYAMEYMKRERPRMVFIAFDETDANGHAGDYDQYLIAANQADERIQKLWQWIQSQPDYKDQTTLFITTDHGRGKGMDTWKNHRLLAAGSRHIWFAVLGPDTPSFGELKFKGKYYQQQVAKTLAAFLGMQYEPQKPAGDVIQTMLGVPQLQYDNVYSENSAADISLEHATKD